MDIQVISQGGQVDLGYCNNVSNTESKTQSKTVEENRYTKEELDKSLDKLNKFLEEENTYAVYQPHEVFGDIMIKIINRDTKEVVFECPPKKVIDLVAKMCEMAGILVDKKA